MGSSVLSQTFISLIHGAIQKITYQEMGWVVAEKNNLDILLEPLNPKPLEPPSFITLSNIPVEANLDLSSEGLPEFAEGLLPSALAFEFEEEDSLRRDWKQKNNE